MANKKYFTDESLATFVDETKSYLDSHAGNTTVHITSTERTNWNAAKTHADSAHAPSNAEPNQNAFSNIAVSGQTTVAADAKQDTVTFAGSNVSITTDATNDKVTFTVADGSTSAKGVIQLTNSTSSTSTTTAATPSSVKSAYDLANTAKTNAATAQAKADSAYSLAEGKVDSLSDLGVTATAAELNYVTNVTSDIQSQLDGKAASGHTHNYAGSSSAGGAATSANKVNKSLTVQLNGGTTEGTNKFTFDGSNAKSVNITPSAIGAAASSHGTHVSYSTTAPVMDGTASAGSASTVARSDHKHPTDTSRAAASEVTALKGLVGDTAVTTQISNAIGSTKYAGSSSVGGAATSANKVNKSLTVKLNGGTTEGTNLFTFNGSAAKTVNITPSSIGAFSSSGGTVSGNVYATGYIQSNGNMVCGGNMSATGSISSTSHIHATDYIQSDKSIYSKNVVQSDGNMVCCGEFTSKGSMFAESEIFIKNNKCIRGTHAGSTSMTADTSSIIAYINDSDRLIVGSANNTGRTEVRSPGYLVLHTNSGTSISAASAVQFVYDTSYFFRPGKDASTYLGGASYKWKQVYASTATISTSDRNLKKNIKDLDDRYIELFDLIRPVSYQLLSGDRLHTGFIAQEVEEAMEKVGLTAEELGFFCRDIKVVNDTENESDVPVLDEDGNPVYIYSLRYEEYIAIMAEKIRRLEAKYDNRLNQLELELAELKANLN